MFSGIDCIDCDSVNTSYNPHCRKLYQCSLCGKAIIRKLPSCKTCVLHTGDKPNQCTKCDNAYKEHTQVSNIIIHTVDKPYKCRHSIVHSHRIPGKAIPM